MGGDPYFSDAHGAMQQRFRDLAGEVARLAGNIAESEMAVAAALERRASLAPDRAASLLEQAVSALAFAEHERQEQDRWQRIHDGEPPD